MGWIKLDRSIENHWIWRDKAPFDHRSAWTDLLLQANYKQFKVLRKGKLTVRNRGEVNTSTRFLADRWHWSRGRVERFLRVLEDDQMVTLKRAADGTTIIIENYAKYQGGQATDGATDGANDGANDGATDGATDGANDKKEKKDKEIKEEEAAKAAVDGEEAEANIRKLKQITKRTFEKEDQQ